MHRKKQKSINILIPDGEVKFALYVIRDLSNYRFIKVHILSKYKWVETRFSKNISSFTYSLEIHDEDKKIEIIKKEIIKKNIDVLFPVHIKSIRLLSKYKDEFKNLLTNLILPSTSSFGIANNKWSLYKFLVENNINSPKTIHSKDLISKSYLRLDFPVLVKPLGKMGGHGIEKVDSIKSLKSFMADTKDIIIQKFIKGFDIDMSVLCQNGKILAYTIQKGYIFSKVPRSPALGVEFVYEKEIYQIVEKLMNKLNWTSFAHIDLRYDEEEKNFKVIEINPRVWGSIEMSGTVGVNFPYLYCMKSLNVKFDIPKYRFEKCVNNTGLIKVLKQKFSNKKIRYSSPNKYIIKNYLFDIKPCIYKILIKKIKRVLPFSKDLLYNFKYEIY